MCHLFGNLRGTLNMILFKGHEAIGVPPHSPLIIEIELVHAVRRHPIDLFHDTDVDKDGKINQIEMVNLLRKQVSFILFIKNVRILKLCKICIVRMHLNTK